MKVLVTRPKSQSETFIKKLRDLGAETLSFPAIEIKALDNPEFDSALDNLNKFDWIIFSSANGVEIFFEKFFNSKRNSYECSFFGIAPKIAVIGLQTAEILHKYHLKADLIPKDFVAESLFEEFVRMDIKDKRFLLPCANLSREYLSEQLSSLGAIVEQLSIYETVRPDSCKIELLISELESGNINYITFTSSSSVSNFYEFIKDFQPEKLLQNSKILCIGPITAQTVKNTFNLIPLTAEKYTIEGMIELLISDLKNI